MSEKPAGEQTNNSKQRRRCLDSYQPDCTWDVFPRQVMSNSVIGTPFLPSSLGFPNPISSSSPSLLGLGPVVCLYQSLLTLTYSSFSSSWGSVRARLLLFCPACPSVLSHSVYMVSPVSPSCSNPSCYVSYVTLCCPNPISRNEK
jgi:hypothetical protein